MLKNDYRVYKVKYICKDPTHIMLFDTYIFDSIPDMAIAIQDELIGRNCPFDVEIYTNPANPKLRCTIKSYRDSTNIYIGDAKPPFTITQTTIHNLNETLLEKYLEDLDKPMVAAEEDELKKKEPIKPMANYDLTDDGKGKKYDTGKPMVGTLCRVFPRALLGVGKCIEFGTRKYPNPNNWRNVEDGEKRYLDSLMRHLLKHLSGQERDEETGLPHLFHACWNLLAITEFYLMKHGEIDEELLK